MRPRRTGGVIVAGFNGSPASKSALHHAAALARAINAELQVVSVWQELPHQGVGREQRAAAQVAEDAVRRAVDDEFRGGVPPWARYEAVEGAAARTLIDVSATSRMLVVGTRPHLGLAAFGLGSVSDACAHSARCPVMIVPPGEPVQWWSPR